MLGDKKKIHTKQTLNLYYFGRLINPALNGLIANYLI